MAAASGPTPQATGLEFPPGARMLNAPDPSQPASPARRGEAERAAALHPRAQSVDRRRQADAQLATAELQMQQVRAMGMGEDSPMFGLARDMLRDARAAHAVAYGRRAPTAKELERVNTREELVDAELEYAAARVSSTWRAREAAQQAHLQAVQAHAAARQALVAAHAQVRADQEQSADSPPLANNVKAFDDANAAFKLAQQNLAAARSRLDAAHAADWRGRRAWWGLQYARRRAGEARGQAQPPPIPAAALRRGQKPVEGPAQHEDFPPHLWDREMVIQLANAKSLQEHQDLVFRMQQEDPTREIGLFRNSRTGEWIVVRGKESTVVVESAPGSGDQTGGQGPAGGGQRQRWKELLGKGSDVGEWELVAHTHPSQRGQAAKEITKYPSGYEGDMSVMRGESERDGWRPKASTIYWLNNGIRRQTDFGYDPNNMRPYWFQIDGQPAQRFETLEAYQRHVRDALVPFGPGNQPAFKPIPPDYVEVFGMEGADEP